jgi:hypothetical protein
LITPKIESAGGSKIVSPGIQSPRAPLSKIGNAAVTSPGRVSINQKQSVSPARFIAKSLITNPTSPRISTDGLPVFSQINP